MDATEQIGQLLQTYERSLDTSDAELAASLYTDDAVFMPTALPTATGETTAEANRELFVFHRVDGSWKIARYMFNKAE